MGTFLLTFVVVFGVFDMVIILPREGKRVFLTVLFA